MPRPAKTVLARLEAHQGPSPWITPKEAADYLGVSIDTIYEACAKKGLRHFKVGHSTIRLTTAWINAWAEARAVGGA